MRAYKNRTSIILIKSLARIEFLIVLFFATGLAACAKRESPCLKSSGRQVVISEELPSFNHLKLLGKLDLNLVKGDQEKILLEAGENLIPFIRYYAFQDTLFISNENSCSWLRAFDSKLTVSLEATQLKSLVIESSGEIRSDDSLLSSDIVITNNFGGGNVELYLSNDSTHIYSLGGAAHINLKGRSNYLYAFQSALAPLQLSDCDVNVLHVRSESPADCKVKTRNLLITEIRSSGSICYVTKPDSFISVKSGTGNVSACP